jgi:hypothetical protein
MTLNFKVGTMPARKYHACRLRKMPAIGQVFEIVDKAVHGSRPLRVRLTEVRTHTGGGDIYFVEHL